MGSDPIGNQRREGTFSQHQTIWVSIGGMRMNVRSVLSIAALVSAMSVSGLAMAQEEHMISGKAVPADQVTAVQEKCDELRKAETDGDAAATDTSTEAPAADTTTTTAGWNADGSEIDLEALTVSMCDEGKFTATAM
jgi:hypothetical protein